MTTEKTIAEKLLQIKAIRLNLQNPFTWASGWKSPIYCDNRKSLSFPQVRDYIKSELANLVDTSFPEAELIAGVATAGIPLGVLVADLLKLPFIYVRAKPKDHGLGNQVEGYMDPGRKVVVIEDLVSTGKSSLEACDALKAAGAYVIGLASVFNYGFDQAVKAFAAAAIPTRSLSNYEALIRLAADKGQFTSKQLEVLEQWRIAPEKWGK
ncbi:MAG TPA: orotate phosphoribosyltransferase [Chitinophagaceae bacterium]|nr:orotate phosphoribosyltransferase [Chitinophagaceae bacterium]